MAQGAVSWTDMTAQLSQYINRGTSFDSFIRPALRRAIFLLEQNNTFKYMWTQLTFSKGPVGGFDITETVAPLGSGGIKKLSLVRYNKQNPTVDGIEYVFPEETTLDEVGVMPSAQDPTFYYPAFGLVSSAPFSGPQHYLQFGTQAWLRPLTLEIFGYLYSNVETIANDPNNKLYPVLNLAEGAVMAQAMINLAPVIRQPEIIPTWQGILQEELKVMLVADEDLYGAQRLDRMEY